MNLAHQVAAILHSTFLKYNLSLRALPDHYIFEFVCKPNFSQEKLLLLPVSTRKFICFFKLMEMKNKFFLNYSSKESKIGLARFNQRLHMNLKLIFETILQGTKKL